MGRKDKQKAPRKREDGETAIQDVLNDACSTNFHDKSSCESFRHRHRIRLEKRRGATQEDEVLHALAKKQGLSNLQPHQAFIIWAIQEHSQLLECQSDEGKTPLHQAIEKKNHHFVSLVLNHAKPDKIKSVLSIQDDDGMTSLHAAIDEGSPYTEAILAKIQDQPKINPTALGLASSAFMGETADVDKFFTVKTKDTEAFMGMTPLHLAVTYSSEPDDTRHEPPASGSEQAIFAEVKKAHEPPQYNKAINQPSLPAGSQPFRPNSRSRDEPFFKPLQRTKTTEMSINGASVSHPALAPTISFDPGNLARTFDLLHVVQKLITAKPRVLVDFEDLEHRTPFQARMAHLKKERGLAFSDERNRESEAERNKFIAGDTVLSYMREYIIDNFSRADAMKALYKIGHERAHEFDLSGLPRPSIDAEYLEGLQKVLWFEGLLKYVALPRLLFEADEGLGLIESNLERSPRNKGQDQANKSNKGKGLQYMYPIFRWLKDQGVKSVLKVTVIDDVEPSHSDQVIEECLNELNVRTWNWYKVDLCCDVILKSASNARDVTLYSSGNNAVLKGWSSPEGLPKLKQGLESHKRLTANMTTFKDTLEKLAPGVAVTWKDHKPDSNYNAVFVDRNRENQPVSKWMKRLEDFAAFLRDAKPEGVEPIKIAIIDDGIDTSLDDFTSKIQVGESFHSLSELSGRRGAYYVPSGPHGTLMAKAICSICPKVKLYIAQLEVLPGPHGQRSFTVESATAAIKWSVIQKVDIISMSWFINSSADLPGLFNALRSAENSGIAMFCASIDEGGMAPDNTWPGRSKSCIKIGACTGDGDKLSWVSEKNSSFLFPGDAPISVVGNKDQWSPHRPMLAGSSVATARAAGLAAILLYCDKLIKSQDTDNKLQPPSGGGDVNKPKGQEIHPSGNNKLEEAFTTLCGGPDSPNKFPRVWLYMPDPQSLKWDNSSYPEETKETRLKLVEFLSKLRPPRA